MFGIIAFLSDNYMLMAIITLSACIYCCFFKKLFGYKHFIIFILIFMIGNFNSSFHLKYDDELASFADSNVNIEAKVISIPTNNIKDRTKFYANVTGIKTDEIQRENISAKSLITINDEDAKIKKIKIGDTLNLTGRLKVPSPSKNPCQFDYAKYLQYKNTFTLVYAEQDWTIISHATDFKGKLIRKLNDTKNHILSIHAQNVKSPMLEILGGIIFGDDAVNPDEEIKTSFINSGIFHILAASGMNVTLIFGIWFFFARNLRFNYRFSIITGILLILFYTLMTGFGPPIIRAALMLTLILIGKLLDRAASTLSLLFMVAFLMLLYNPLMLVDIGFQLSFIVTFALILTSPLLVFSFKNKALNYILGACCIPVIAQLYAAPLQMFYFNTFSMYSVFANIAIIPVLSIVSFIGFMSSMLAIIPAIAQPVCKIADFILNPLLFYIVSVAQFFSELPYSIKDVQKPMLLQIILYFIIIVSITCILRAKIKSKKILIALSVLILVFFLSFIKIPDKNPEIIFFSVGNADSALIKTPNRDYIMIDTAKSGYLNSQSQAKYIMIKFLKEKGIKNLKALILSHFDSDHTGGTVDILENINTETVYLTDVYEDTEISDSILKYIADNKINSVSIKGIQKIYDNDGFVITIIKPDGNEIKTENQKSLIVHCKYKDKNYLFMGDGDVKSFEALPDDFKNNITVIKSGHHGAKDTINSDMVNSSDLFIISTGPNPYNHPNPETIAVIDENNGKYLRTDYGNAVKIIQEKEKIKVYSYSPKYKKFKETVTF